MLATLVETSGRNVRVFSPSSQKFWRDYKKRLANVLAIALARADAAVCTIQAAYYRYQRKVGSKKKYFVHRDFCFVLELGFIYMTLPVKHGIQSSVLRIASHGIVFVPRLLLRIRRTTVGVVGEAIAEEEK